MKRIISILLMLTLLGSTALAEGGIETDWYETHARELADDVYQLCSSEHYRESIGLTPTLIEYLTEWAQAIETGAIAVERNAHDAELASMESLAQSLPKVSLRTKSLGSVLSSLKAGQQSSEFVAASASVIVSMGYRMPEGFTPCDITFHYDGIDIAVFFSQYGESVVRGEAFIMPSDEE